MRTDFGTLLTLALHFGLLSIAAVGGGTSAMPEIHRQAVVVSQWMTERQFADIFAISQAAPGPNFLISTLIGYHVAGAAGAIVATLAMCGPSSVLAYYVAGTWEKFKYARWRIAVQAADHTAVAYAVTAITAVITYMTRLNPAWLFLIAGLLGLAGLV